MSHPTLQEIEDFLSSADLGKIFDYYFPRMKGHHFRAFPIQTQSGYAIEVSWYPYNRELRGPISHQSAKKMKREWQIIPLPSLTELCPLRIGVRSYDVRFFHRKGYLNIPP